MLLNHAVDFLIACLSLTADSCVYYVQCNLFKFHFVLYFVTILMTVAQHFLFVYLHAKTHNLGLRKFWKLLALCVTLVKYSFVNAN